MTEPDPAPASPCGELNPGKGIDGDRVRVYERTHIADEQIGFAVLQQNMREVA